MLEFLRENIVFVVSSILITAGLVTVAVQVKNPNASAVPVSENTQVTSDPGMTTQVPTPSAASFSSHSSSSILTSKTSSPKPTIHRANNNEGESFDD